MAVSDALSLHTEGGYDLQDMLGAPAYSLAVVVLTGIGTFSIFGFAFSETLLSYSSLTVSIALMLAVVLLGLSWVTNRAGDGWDDLDEIESIAVGGAMFLFLGMAAIPAVRDFVLGSEAVGIVAFIVLSAAYVVTAWY
jgi:hypothetical protein